MKCPVCHQGEMVSGIKDIPYTFRGRKTVLKGIHGLYCVHCEESIMNKEESDAFMAQVKAFRASVNAETVAPEFIVKVRKKLSLTQKEASEIFGGGVNAFSRYEKGNAQPHPSTIKLLRVLEKHPELLNEIR
ncbi:type II TA system antitoxin MqsA family protein [Escherichia coli]|uniref:type II TA system antitoxin MqsA family protein n=1 Tax=Escherichia coli TaxID=562 RepID=UPI001ABCBD63|nr:type II TA system antitoxin MqsA family protein [Escherichia coli]